MATRTQSTPDQDAARAPLDRGERPDDRDERPLERLDRNEVELMGELRVAATGIQVLLAFLLIVPFNSRWGRVSAFDRYDYFVTLLCIAAAAALLIAPTVHHRVLFRRGEKDYLVRLGNRSAIIAMALLTIGLTGILVLLSHVLFGAAAAIIVGTVTLCGVGTLWFGVPLAHSRRG
jgi:uncharacterized membrane protein YiaA